MNSESGIKAEQESQENTDLQVRQMRDYCQVGMDLIWQRQIIFAAALALAAYYYSVWVAVICSCFIAVSEVFDFIIFRRILSWDGSDPAVAQRFLHLLYFGTVLSASVIVIYAIGIAYVQGPTTHFMPLFFLFAAALFAAMNNHQILPILLIRLIIYGATFVFIPVRDIVLSGASIDSELWAQLFTSVFVLYFVVDCSRIYLNFYRSRLKQLDLLRSEHEKTLQASQAKSEFLSTMSHELRTPLTSIKGSVDLASSGKLGETSEQIANVLQVAQRNCVRMLDLVEEILDLQKAEAGKLDVEFKLLNLAEVLRDTVDDSSSYADRLGIRLNLLQCESDVMVTSDKARLKQVFSNILSNATKFSPSGGEVTISMKSNDETVIIDFSDHGIGLDESDAERVFDRFSQLDSSDQRETGGTGLGMNIAKRIMAALCGKIGYRRNIGKGTTFFVELPRLHQRALDAEVKKAS